MKRKKIEKAIEKADKRVDVPFTIRNKGDLEAMLKSRSDDERQYVKELLAETLDQLFNKKKHKKD